MKKLISKIRQQLKNTGSSIVLVIVALAFVGILAGALLTAVASVYRLKAYDYNAQSNFYYLEQAMDEIYAGVGQKSMSYMLEAYEDTRESVVYYSKTANGGKGGYVNMPNEDANKLFKDTFMSKLSGGSSYFNIVMNASGVVDDTTALPAEMKSMISNPSVKLDASRMRVVKLDENGGTYVDGEKLGKIIIKNIILSRSVDYKRSSASGNFSQTISTDIEISRPDFEVNFNNDKLDSDTLFEYCMLSDKGVEVDKQYGQLFTVNGNVYAASDFYNKNYNYYDVDPDTALKTITNSSSGKSYKMNKVDNIFASGNLLNKNLLTRNSATEYKYDGKNDNSKYSGFYVNGTNVSVVASEFIVPGSLAVMNSGSLIVVGSNGSSLDGADVWADEVVLGGEKRHGALNGSQAIIHANMFVRDDTTIESDDSALSVYGNYFGYSRSKNGDHREFTAQVAKTTDTNSTGLNIYQEKDTDGSTINRGHYDSSAIIMNGKNSAINLSNLDNLYLAGRSYIETSKVKAKTTASSSTSAGTSTTTGSSTGTGTGTTAGSGTSTGTSTTAGSGTSTSTTTSSSLDVGEATATTDGSATASSVHDYKTGESVSVKSTQLAYIPSSNPVEDPKTHKFTSTVSATLAKSALFKKYFRTSETSLTVPVAKYDASATMADGTTKTNNSFYFDFDDVANYDFRADTAYYGTPVYTFFIESENIVGTNANLATNHSLKADTLKKNFIKDYFDFFQYGYDYANGTLTALPSDVDSAILPSSVADYQAIAAGLQDVTNYSNFLAGKISVDTTSNIYASGIITKKNTDAATATAVTSDPDDHVANLAAESGNTSTSYTSSLTLADYLELDPSSTAGSTIAGISDEIAKHYDYVKWGLKDDLDTSDIANEVNVIKGLNGSGATYSENYLTPINKYMNFDEIETSTDINPTNLKLDGYKVWISGGDVEVNVPNSRTESTDISGIIIAKGDVYFNDYPASSSNKAVTSFKGIIITGGKIYYNSDTMDDIRASVADCKGVLNSCLTKASLYNNPSIPSTDKATVDAEALRAIKVLKSFKDYYDLGQAYEDGSATSSSSSSESVDITTIDYTKVVRYSNWMKNVETD